MLTGTRPRLAVLSHCLKRSGWIRDASAEAEATERRFPRVRRENNTARDNVKQTDARANADCGGSACNSVRVEKRRFGPVCSCLCQ